ncbi:MAG: allophanate hydrolase [Pseudomonadota bacterium]|nr:allophanate hydrolase [Pseudomonadota bacterium]
MDMTIAGLQTAYREQKLTPEQVIERILLACDEHSESGIWINRLSREQIDPYLANLADKSIEALPLYGIPFAIKDNIDLAGIPTTAACAEFSYVPGKSAFVVEQLIQAGAIPIGKTNMDQFATGLVGIRSPEPWGPCSNAFDPEYISGGSSSGSAVAVALGLVTFSLGTDTAGSGRVPAAFNNLVGLKPSRGLLSMTGVVPACRSLDCVSIFALTTDDANAVFEQAASYDAGDDYSRPNPFANNARQYGLPQGEFVFGVPRSEQLEFFGDESAAELFDQAVEKLEALGGRKQVIDFTPFLEAARLLYEGPWVAERYAAIETMMAEQPGALLPVIRTIIGAAEGKTAVETFKAQYRLQHYYKQTMPLLQQVDFLVTPTAGTIYTIEEVLADPIRLNSNLGYYTNYMNLLDCSAVAVPVGFLDNGLPWGMTLVAPAMADRKLLSYANRWQQALELSPGATQRALVESRINPVSHEETIPVVVCGAHLQGLPLNWQLTERGAILQAQTRTAAAYRMVALPGGPPYRPGLIRDDQAGQRIEVEVWSVPKAEFGSFVAGIPAPLGIGKLELEDGRWLPGFICEGYATENATDITEQGGWRHYLASCE